MLAPPLVDDALSSLPGFDIPSSCVPGVTYRIGQPLGEGGMCLAFYAIRVASDGQRPVVVKIVRPAFVRESRHAVLIVQKEAVALGRLNERIPPTPFVVQLVDTGVVAVQQRGVPIELPWLAVEYVHGGAEGTTLTARVRYSVHTTGAAFDMVRAAHAVDCLSRALSAVHDVGVIHRDIKPDNVLCCGFGDREMFKVADFGVARPAGLQGTFHGALAGTPGYAAPELQSGESTELGPPTDVFSLAPTIFYVLTGEEYFPARTPLQHVAFVTNPRRRSILEAPTLVPELREREDVCRNIDSVLARASSLEPAKRPQSAEELGAMLLRCLDVGSQWGRALDRRHDTVLLDASAAPVTGWSWSPLHHPGHSTRVRSVAWDADGRCLVANDHGLAFWDGTTLHEVPTGRLPKPDGVRFVHRTGPGQWMMGGDAGMIAAYTANGIENVIVGADTGIDYHLFSGTINDLGVVVGAAPGSHPSLFALAGRWWLKPRPLEEISVVTSLARYDQERWMLAGVTARGEGYAALYSPLNWEIERVDVAGAGRLWACASNADRRVGLAVGAQGVTVGWNDRTTWVESIPGGTNLTAVGVDEVGCAWAGGPGRLFRRQSLDSSSVWECVWEDPRWSSPFVSIFSVAGYVLAMTENGGIVEGRHVDMTARSDSNAVLRR